MEYLEDAYNTEQVKETIDMCNENGMVPKYAVLFIAEDGTSVHSVFYGERPNVASIAHNIEEMKFDKEFGVGEKEANALDMAIIPIKDGGTIK